MKVKVIRAFLNKNVIAVEGSVIEVSTPRAEELEKKGLVVPTIGGKTGNSDPFPQRQVGGQIGAEKNAPSLPEVQAPEKKSQKKQSRKQKSVAK